MMLINMHCHHHCVSHAGMSGPLGPLLPPAWVADGGRLQDSPRLALRRFQSEGAEGQVPTPHLPLRPKVTSGDQVTWLRYKRGMCWVREGRRKLWAKR